ncbi:MAG: formate dehydrogenase accessory sulfurtransferase FdhD [Armatimonadota bacterium]
MEHTDPISHCHALRLSGAELSPVPEDCRVVVEQPLTITVDDVGEYTLMCTPTHTVALAVGFAFSEGLIGGLRDIDLLYHCEDDPGAVRLRLGRAPERTPQRNMVVASSCGLCGCVDVEAVLATLPRVGEGLIVPAATLLTIQAEMRRRQQLFAQTGGTHAAAVFTAEGEIAAFAEDLGRHNALDKCIGLCLLTERPLAGHGVVLSGRVSLEMVTKAARAGLELIAAVSAPSSLAVDAAEQSGITLCGFLREDRLTVFTHPMRITG